VAKPSCYICFVKRLILLFSVSWLISGAQVVPGKCVSLASQNQFVSFGEVLQGVRTISLWIKPNNTITAANPIERPILVRDENSPAFFGTGEVNLFWGKTGTPYAGHIVFTRGTVTTGYTIKSDDNYWASNRWYHISVVLHPTLGMQMYINGIKQQETNPSTEPFYFRNEGNTGSLYLGKWGIENGYTLPATVDEIRFYTSGLDENQIRASMCSVVPPPYAGLAAYYTFDNASGNSVPSKIGTIHGIPVGMNSTSYSPSNAPLGETSVQHYGLSSSTTLQLSKLASLQIDNLQTSADGVHLYATYDVNLVLEGSYPYFFGVWFTDTVATYRATINYDNALAKPCDSCAEVESRDNQTQTNWNKRPGYPDTCTFVLPNESPGTQPWREEYWVKPKRILDIGIPDTIVACEGRSVPLTAKLYNGASYLWDDGSTNRQRNVDSTGYYFVIVKYDGCIDTAGTWVLRQFMPVFTLGPDTIFCAGDTVVLAPNINIDSATYIWGSGLHIGRTFRMYFPGTISLAVTVGNCTYTDEITLTMIRPFQVNLGPDTTLCLGEEYTLGAPPGQRYLWSTGSITNTTTVYNRPQTVWVKAWNECFERTDTVNIDYEECACHFYVANTFSPNGDGDNDIFKPVTSCIYEYYELEVYDRWGNRVFATTNIDVGWDGTFQGKPLPIGVYSYQLKHKKFTSLADPAFERGTLNLIR
jgi:gliding motility-associated-like protein